MATTIRKTSTYMQKKTTYQVLQVEGDVEQDSTTYVLDTTPATKEAVPAASFTKQRTSFKGTRRIPLVSLANALGVKLKTARPFETYDPLAGLDGHKRDTMRVTLLIQLDQLALELPALKEQARHLITKIEAYRDTTIQDESKQPRKFQNAKEAALTLIQKAKDTAAHFQRLAQYLHPDPDTMPFQLNTKDFQPLTDFQAKYDPGCWTDLEPVYAAKDLPDPTVVARLEAERKREIRLREREIQKRLQRIRYVEEDDAHDDEPTDTMLLTSDFFHMLDDIPDVTPNPKLRQDGKPSKRNARDDRLTYMAESRLDEFTCPEHYTVVLHKGSAYLAPNQDTTIQDTPEPEPMLTTPEPEPMLTTPDPDSPFAELTTQDDDDVPDCWEDLL
jgi:hypothetical protein